MATQAQDTIVAFEPSKEARATLATMRADEPGLDAAHDGHHAADLKLSVPFWGSRFYIRFLAGPERRNMARLQQEGQVGALRITLFYAAVAFALVAVVLAGGALFSYLIEATIGLGRPGA